MPAKITLPDKICKQCGKRFNRKQRPSGVLEACEEFRNRKFCSHKCFSQHNTRTNHWLWKGGVRRRPDGYLRYTDNDEYVHRRAMEEHLGRKLGSDEFVHHINGELADNTIRNLKVLSNSEHRKIHCRQQPRDSGGRWCHRE